MRELLAAGKLLILMIVTILAITGVGLLVWGAATAFIHTPK